MEVLTGAAWIEDRQVCFVTGLGKEYDAHVVEGASRTTSAFSLDTLLAPLDKENYIKMEAEGAEQEISPAPCRWAAKAKSLKVEVHAPWAVDECQAQLEGLGSSD